MTSATTARLGWSVYGVVALLLAATAYDAWVGLVVKRLPALYGEGAVANAARLLREGALYQPTTDGSFFASNYPPLYFVVAAIGDAFISGRVASILATLSVAVLVLVLARPAGALVAGALALGWIGLAPVMIWGPAIKPDPLAIALTAGATFALALSTANARAAGLLLAAAVATKPTALLPAIVLGVWLWRTDRAAFRTALPGVASAALAGAILVIVFGPANVARHLITYNALAWSAEKALLLALLGAVVVGIMAVAALVAGAWRGPFAAYGVGALAIVTLGGREGATINYLLDLAAASMLALASVAPRLGTGVVFPLAGFAQLALGVALLNPLALIPGRSPTTGAWADRPSRQLSFFLGDDPTAPASRVLAEDSAILVLNGIRPVVDDLFLWSRLVDRGAIDPAPLLARLRRNDIETVVSEVDLARLNDAPAYERERWDPRLVEAVLARYRRLPSGPPFVYSIQ